MTWMGEKNGSGILVLQDGGSYGVLTGQSGHVLQWNGDEPVFAPVPVSGVRSGVARWAESGDILQGSPVLINDSGTITMPGGQIVNGRISNNNDLTLVQTDWLFISTSIIDTIVYLPSSPSVWQVHNVKDGNGSKDKKNKVSLIVNGNGNNIDGMPTAVINSPYSCLTVIYNGSEWNII